MSKVDEYQEIVLSFLNQQSYDELRIYLLEHSHLPGAQGNLPLSEAFAKCFQLDEIIDSSFHLLEDWKDIQCDTNEPLLLLPFCAVRALGFVYPKRKTIEMDLILKNAMNDSRWRMRESIAMAMQHIGESDENLLIDLIGKSYPLSSFYEKRAFLAALAHPPILKKSEKTTNFALQICDSIINDLYQYEMDIKQEDYRALFKGLSYAISVFVAYLPINGFAYMKEWALLNHKEVHKILKDNLNKTRISKPFPNECAEITALLKSK